MESGSYRFRSWLALLDPPSARQQEHTRPLSRCERYAGSLESSRRKIGVFTGSSTFEPLVMNASQSLFAAPKYPTRLPCPQMPALRRHRASRSLSGLRRTETMLSSAESCRQLLSMGPTSENGSEKPRERRSRSFNFALLPTSKPSERSA